MALFPEKSGIGNVDAPGSEGSRWQFLAENSAGWETSAPIRPERQGIAAGPALDQQLQSRAPWTHADLGCLAGAAACARRSIERPRGGLESKRKSQRLSSFIGLGDRASQEPRSSAHLYISALLVLHRTLRSAECSKSRGGAGHRADRR